MSTGLLTGLLAVQLDDDELATLIAFLGDQLADGLPESVSDLGGGRLVRASLNRAVRKLHAAAVLLQDNLYDDAGPAIGPVRIVKGGKS